MPTEKIRFNHSTSRSPRGFTLPIEEGSLPTDTHTGEPVCVRDSPRRFQVNTRFDGLYLTRDVLSSPARQL